MTNAPLSPTGTLAPKVEGDTADAPRGKHRRSRRRPATGPSTS